MLVVDTSVWIDFLNGHPSLESDYLGNCLAEDVPIVVPGIIRAEVLAGLRSETEAERIAGMLAALDPAPEATTDDYEAAAAIYRRCRGSGRAVGSVVDCVVAQCCVRHGYALLTKDRDFRRIAAHTALRVIEFS